MSNQIDFTLDGTGFRVVRGEDGQIGYKYSIKRPIIQRQDTNDEKVLMSDPNRWGAYQSSWARGSAWWKPSLIEEPDSYYLSNGIDPFTRAGMLVPVNELVLAQNTNLQGECPVVLDVNATPFIVGTTSNVNASYFDPYHWSGTAWVQDTFTSGVAVANVRIYDQTFSVAHAKVFVLSGDTVPDTTAQIDAYSSTGFASVSGSVSVTTGSALFMHNDLLVIYNGDVLRYIDDPLGTPVATAITDDGFGGDYLDTIGDTADRIINPESVRLAMSTAEGIYYVKNVISAGVPMPYVFRVEKDQLGNWNSVPIATLPSGTVAFNIGYHLGSVIIAASEDYSAVIANDTDVGDWETTFYHITGGNLGTIGKPLGGDTLSETVWNIVASRGAYLYISGTQRLWVYDAIRGGMHPLYNHAASGSTPETVHSLVAARDTGNDYAGLLAITSQQYVGHLPADKHAVLETVATLGTDFTTYVIESNYFDFETPMEDKGIIGVHILSDAITSNARWTLQIAVDDGAFTTFTTHSGIADGYTYTVFSSAAGTWTGKRFRYKLIYETKTATERVPLRAVMFEAMPNAKSVEIWNLRADGTEFSNVEGEVLRPRDVYNKILFLAVLDRPVELADYMYYGNREDAFECTVMVQEMVVNKDQPNEAYIDFVLERANTQP